MVTVGVCICIAVWYSASHSNPGLDDEIENLPFIEGTVLKVEENGMFENTTIYNITLDNHQKYQMIFKSSDAVVPPIDVALRFYYEMIGGYYGIVKIKSL